MIKIIAKLFAVAVALAAFLLIAPTFAAAGSLVTFVSSTGSDSNPCTAALPCGTIVQAITATTSGGQVNCLNSQYGNVENAFTVLFLSYAVTIDCPGVVENGPNAPLLRIEGTDNVVKFRNLTFSGADGGSTPISFTGGGTLILENCVFENYNAPNAALDIEPTGPLNLVITNSRMSNGGTVAIVLKPAAGGSINATFDHVTVTNNGGGGIRLDATNGPVTADVTDSVISNNAGNGLNASGGAGGAAMLSIHNSVIAKNGAAGVSSSGANGAALVDTTLLDSNASGATSVVAGGHMLTYVNNRIIGPAGAGFTATASPQ